MKITLTSVCIGLLFTCVGLTAGREVAQQVSSKQFAVVAAQGESQVHFAGQSPTRSLDHAGVNHRLETVPDKITKVGLLYVITLATSKGR